MVSAVEAATVDVLSPLIRLILGLLFVLLLLMPVHLKLIRLLVCVALKQ
jgi:hypothetical protein